MAITSELVLDKTEIIISDKLAIIMKSMNQTAKSLAKLVKQNFPTSLIDEQVIKSYKDGLPILHIDLLHISRSLGVTLAYFYQE